MMNFDGLVEIVSHPIVIIAGLSYLALDVGSAIASYYVANRAEENPGLYKNDFMALDLHLLRCNLYSIGPFSYVANRKFDRVLQKVAPLDAPLFSQETLDKIRVENQKI